MNTWHTKGFENLKRYFDAVIALRTPTHAYLLHGQESIGKRTFALEIARKIRGDQATADAKIITADTQDGQSTIGIDEIRQARNYLSMKPFGSGFHCLIINDAHGMTVEAANALLKILEEPPTAAIIFLVTAFPEQLPPTVLSRCMSFYCPSQSREIIETELHARKLSKPQIDFLVALANGRLGLVLDLIRADRFGEVKKSIASLAELLDADINVRLAWSSQASEKDRGELAAMIRIWLLYIRMSKNGPLIAISGELSRLLAVVDRPQYNMQLALDAFVISLPSRKPSRLG